MPDLEQNVQEPEKPASSGDVFTLRRRVEGTALGAVSGGAAGWLATALGDVHGDMRLWMMFGLATLAAVLGYRYGRSVVVAIFSAFSEAGVGR